MLPEALVWECLTIMTEHEGEGLLYLLALLLILGRGPSISCSCSRSWGWGGAPLPGHSPYHLPNSLSVESLFIGKVTSYA